MDKFRAVSPPLSKETIDDYDNWVRPNVDVPSCLNCKHGIRVGDRIESMFWEFNEPDLNEIECLKGITRFENMQEICDAREIEKYNAKGKFCKVYQERVRAGDVGARS